MRFSTENPVRSSYKTGHAVMCGEGPVFDPLRARGGDEKAPDWQDLNLLTPWAEGDLDHRAAVCNVCNVCLYV